MIDVKEKNVYKSDKVVIERWINDYFFICPFTIFNKNYFDYKKVEKILKKKIKISSKNFYQSFSKKKNIILKFRFS